MKLHCSRYHRWILFCFVLYAVALLPLGGRAESLERPRVGRHLGLVPIFNYSSDRGLSLGAFGQLFDYGEGRLPFESLTAAEFQYATRAARSVFASYERTGLAGGIRSYTEVYASANRYQPYYGLGPSTAFDRAIWNNGGYFYRHREFGFVSSLRKRTASGWDVRFGFGGAYAVSEPNAPETVYARDFGPGVRTGYYSKLIVGAVHEGRDFEFVSSEGQYFSAAATASPGFLGNFGSWGRFDADYRRYDSIIPNRWLWFASQARVTVSSPDAPFTEKARLGSWGTLRGYPFGRFVSNAALSARSEIRTLPVRWQAFGYPLKGGGGLFLDAGEISETPAGLFRGAHDSFKWAWGVTLFGSYFTDDFIGSADLGFSREGTALYLKLGHAI